MMTSTRISTKRLTEALQRRFCAARRPALGAVVAVTMLGATAAQAFPSLDLTPTDPDTISNFITVDYVGDADAGTLTASGFAETLNPGGNEIDNGSFDVIANISSNALTASGTLSLGGTIDSLGFTSGTLLTGTLDSFGAGIGDPLEFLFNVTGGDAAGLFGSTAGVILNQSGYSGSFANSFSSAPFGAQSDTYAFQTATVSEPGTLGLLLFASGFLVSARHKRRPTTT